MKFSVNLVLLLGSCVVSANSFAATNVDIIKNLYENGTAPAAAEDFPQKIYGGKYVTPPANLCVVLDGTDQPYKYNISRTIRVTPAQGPLIPEKTQEKLVFGDTRAFNKFQEPVVQGLDLVLTNPAYKIWVDGHDGTKHSVPGQLFATKSGQFIAFRLFIKHHGTGVLDQNYYGYCYPSNGLPLI